MNYEAQINRNYNVAINYYVAKKKQLLKYLKAQGLDQKKIINQELIEQFSKAFKKYQQDIINKIKAGIDNNEKNNKLSFKFEEKTIDLDITYDDLIELNKINRGTKFGELFEKAFHNYFSDIFESDSGQVNKFISAWTGKIVQEGFTFKKGQDIRADIVWGNQTKENIENTQMEISIELQESLDKLYSKYGDDEKGLSEAVNRKLKKAGYLSGDKVIAGLSLKNYQYNIAYTQSAKLKEQLNAEIENMEFTEHNEIYNYMVCYLSHYLISIISPNVVGLVTTKGLQWMSDVLEDHYFIFHLRQNAHNKFYWVQNTSIFLTKKQKGAISIWGQDGMERLDRFQIKLSHKTS